MAIISKHLFQYSLIFTVVQIQLLRRTRNSHVISLGQAALVKKAHKSGLFIGGESVFDYFAPSNLFLSASEIKSNTLVTCFTPGTLLAISTARFASASVTMPIK